MTDDEIKDFARACGWHGVEIWWEMAIPRFRMMLEFIPEAPVPSGTITDGYGSTWGPCPTCQGAMEVVRPGKAQCTKCG